MERTIALKGLVGFEIMDSTIQAQLGKVKKSDTTIFELNSPGGSVTEGLSIYNTIKNTPGKKIIEIVGSSMSIATLIMLAGDWIRSSAVSLFMFHNSSAGIEGNKEELAAQVEILNKIDNLLIDQYLIRNQKSGKKKLKREDLVSMLKAETWMSPQEALSYGLIDEITDSIDYKVAALHLSNINMKHLNKLRKLLNLSEERPVLTDEAIKDGFTKALGERKYSDLSEEELTSLSESVTSAAKEFVGADTLTAEEAAQVVRAIEAAVMGVTEGEEEEEEEAAPAPAALTPEEEEEKKKKEEEMAALAEQVLEIGKALVETNVIIDELKTELVALRKGTRTFGKKPFVNESTKINMQAAYTDPHAKHRAQMAEIDAKTRNQGRIAKHS